MNNKINYIIILIIISINLLLLGIEKKSENINSIEKLNIYIEEFEKNNRDYENLKKIEKILIEEKNFELLIQFYQIYDDRGL